MTRRGKLATTQRSRSRQSSRVASRPPPKRPRASLASCTSPRCSALVMGSPCSSWSSCCRLVAMNSARSLLQDFDNRIVRRELEDLTILATRSPRDFLALVESTKNRFVRWLGDRRLARILGQKKGLDPLAVMDGSEVVLADLSSLTYSDAALLGCLITSMYFAAARRRPPLQRPRHRLFLDEAESLLTLDVARMCDQSAKYRALPHSSNSATRPVARPRRFHRRRALDQLRAQNLLRWVGA